MARPTEYEHCAALLARRRREKEETTMTIQIHTRLDDRISGGGTDTVHHEWAAGPRNLLTAVDLIAEHRAQKRDSYGNIGCGGSWLSVGRVRLDSSDEHDLVRDTEPGDTRVDRARRYLADVKSGEIARQRQAFADAEREDERLAVSLEGVWEIEALRDAARDVQNRGLMEAWRAAKRCLLACGEARRTGATRISVDRYSESMN